MNRFFRNPRGNRRRRESLLRKLFVVVVLMDPAGIISKYTLFITVNWTTVILADLI